MDDRNGCGQCGWHHRFRLLRRQHTTRCAASRSSGETDSIVDAVRSMMGINLVLGFTLAVVVWIAAPVCGSPCCRFSPDANGGVSDLHSHREFADLVRAIESVGVSTHRAFEQYRRTVQISTAVRLLTLASAAVLALSGRRTVVMLVATSVFMVAGTYMQFRQLRTFLGRVTLWPAFHAEETRHCSASVCSPGCRHWEPSSSDNSIASFWEFPWVPWPSRPMHCAFNSHSPSSVSTASGLNFLFPLSFGSCQHRFQALR